VGLSEVREKTNVNSNNGAPNMNRNNFYLTGNTFAVGNAPNATSFKSGHSPWNKGTVGVMKRNRTSFEPGMTNPNKMPIGTITIRKCKDGKKRKFIKTEYGWTENAKYVWFKHFGPLIFGDVVHHVNGNTLDDTTENLIAIPRKVHPTIHSRWGLHLPSLDLWMYVESRYPALAKKRCQVTLGLPF
jgi:hypothetical protein